MQRLIRLLLAFALLYGFLVVGRFVTSLAALPIPGSVVGMVLLVAALRLRLLSPEAVEEAAGPLLRHMALFFVPPGVALLLFADVLREEWLPIAAGGVVSTLAVLFLVGFLQQRLGPDA